ncbi:MAG TPA: hypothetical protein VIW48_04035, partial [Nitrospiraceae bacterium]
MVVSASSAQREDSEEFRSESNVKTATHLSGKKANWGKIAEPVISSSEATGSNKSILRPDPESTPLVRAEGP